MDKIYSTYECSSRHFFGLTFFKYFMTFVLTHLCGMADGHMGVTHMSQAKKW